MKKLAVVLLVAALFVPGVASAHKLKLGDAHQAAQEAADQYAGQPTVVYKVARQNDHKLFFEAQWVRQYPNPPGICKATLTVRFSPRQSHHISATVTASECL